MKENASSFILLLHCVDDRDLASFRGLGNIRPSLFGKLCKALKAEFDVVSLKTLEEGISGGPGLSERMLAVTFDDGGKSYASFAAPIAGSCEIPTTCFLITGCIGGRSLYWRYLYNYCIRSGRGRELARLLNEAYGTSVDLDDIISFTRKKYDAAKTAGVVRGILKEIVVEEEYREKEGELFLSLHDIKRLAADPLVKFGVHTSTHPVMKSLSDDEIREELSGSIAFYREKIEDDMPMFSIPFGRLGRDFDERTILAALELGVPTICSAYGGGNQVGQPLYNIRRIPVTEAMLEGGIAAFLRKLREADVAPEYREREDALRKAVERWERCRVA